MAPIRSALMLPATRGAVAITALTMTGTLPRCDRYRRVLKSYQDFFFFFSSLLTFHSKTLNTQQFTAIDKVNVIALVLLLLHFYGILKNGLNKN